MRLNWPMGARHPDSERSVYTYDAKSTGVTLSAACVLSAASSAPSHSSGKERDAESGLDYFGARYYASSMGRWMSPDWSAKEEPVPYAKLDNPQSLNLYGYVLNNPMVTSSCFQQDFRKGRNGKYSNH